MHNPVGGLSGVSYPFGVIGYAYLGDMTPEQTDVVAPVMLDVD